MERILGINVDERGRREELEMSYDSSSGNNLS